ncbi:MAG TPA: hypothetical protein PK971_00885 [Saprospiraceae bacterium]|nr:hypothetical protein [Saprospiraceae bacterium]HND86846.1 hypothetical protein [Saprospiraceae bacterium]HNG88573.1 hypothetical protein [Saprospiraceae bacterium]
MSWKKTLPYFAWQSFRYSRNIPEFRRNWSNYGRWMQSFQPEHSSIRDESAWITFDALDFLDQHLKPHFRVFEYGGGGSTLFFCARVASLVTVEHHKDWFQVVKDTVAAKGFTRWTGHFAPPEYATGTAGLSLHDPSHFKSSAPGMENMSFEQYARTIDNYGTEEFDVILVDGRARTSCVVQAIPHLKRGGLLIVDNAERLLLPQPPAQFWDDRFFQVLLDNHAALPYSPDFTKTLILRKL